MNLENNKKLISLLSKEDIDLTELLNNLGFTSEKLDNSTDEYRPHQALITILDDWERGFDGFIIGETRISFDDLVNYSFKDIPFEHDPDGMGYGYVGDVYYGKRNSNKFNMFSLFLNPKNNTFTKGDDNNTEGVVEYSDGTFVVVKNNDDVERIFVDYKNMYFDADTPNYFDIVEYFGEVNYPGDSDNNELSYTAYIEDGQLCIGIRSEGYVAEGFDDVSDEDGIVGVNYMYFDIPEDGTDSEIDEFDITIQRDDETINVNFPNGETIEVDINDNYNETYNTENLLGVWGSWEDGMHYYGADVEYPLSGVEVRYDKEDLVKISNLKEGEFFKPEYGNTFIARLSNYENKGLETLLGTIMPFVSKNNITEYPNAMLADLLHHYSDDNRTLGYIKYVLQKTTETLKYVNNKEREENNDYTLGGLVNFSVDESPEAFMGEGKDGNTANLGLWILSTYSEKDFNEIFDFDVTKFINDLGCYISNLGNTEELFFSDKL